jgi:cytochrome c553
MRHRKPQAWTKPPESGRRLPAGRHAALKVALPAFALAFAVATGARAQSAEVSEKDVQAKLAYCEECHGAAAQGFRGYYPIPRLAGQQTEYLKNQLQAFVERRRTNNIMFNVGHVLSPTMVEGLTNDFHALDPRPIGGAPKELVNDGRKIFTEGIPASDVPPCASCHGPDAKGNGPFPRLAGQLYEYLTAKLANWDKERGQDPKNPDTSAIMEPIAHNLNQSQIRAVAAYLSYLE